MSDTVKRIGARLEIVVDVQPGENNEEAIASFLAQTDVSQGWVVTWEEEVED
jgi:hypothetical protein